MTEEQVRQENALADRIARKMLSGVYPAFEAQGGVPVEVAAKVFGKSATWVREGIRHGLLPIGTVTETDKRTNVYISPKLLWEYTGFIYKGEERRTK